MDNSVSTESSISCLDSSNDTFQYGINNSYINQQFNKGNIR